MSKFVMRTSRFMIGLKTLVGRTQTQKTIGSKHHMEKSQSFVTRIKLLGLAATAGLLAASAGAQWLIAYTDIRGVVTVNGVPTPGVVIEPMCCDTCTIIPCANPDPH